MERPKIEINRDRVDVLIEWIGLVGAIVLIGLPVFYYDKLPDTIPRHYGLNGEPDAYSEKSIIWNLPMIGALLYIAMKVINRFPHLFNYPTEITAENAERQYRNATKMIRALNTLIVCMFAYMSYATIQTSLGYQKGLGILFTPIFLVLIFGVTGFFLYKSMKK